MITFAAFSVRTTEQQYFDEVEQTYEGQLELAIRETEPLTLERAQDLPNYIDAVLLLPAIPTTAEILEVLKNKGVKLIGMRSAGVDSIDMDAAEKLGLIVVNVPDYSPQAIAEIAVYFILMGLRNMKEVEDMVRIGAYAQSKRIGKQLSTQTVGIYGFGHIGKTVAKLLEPFGCEVVAYVNPKYDMPTDYPAYVRLETDESAFFAIIDVLTLHVPLTSETTHLINKESIASMRKGSMIVNTARGGLVDTQAVLDALDDEQLAFYAADVYEYETPIFSQNFANNDAIDDELYKRFVSHPKALVTPHIAFNTYTSVENMVKFCVVNALKALQ